jgi:hypothetical protein
MAMKRAKIKLEYQQSSRDASEEDAGDNDSISSIYDSATTTPPPRLAKINLVNDSEDSATTSEALDGHLHSQKGKGKCSVKALDMVDKRYVDVNSEISRQMNPAPTDRPVRIYSDGIFDLFHIG